MMASRPEICLTTPNQAELDWLIAQAVSTTALVQPAPMMIATGTVAADGQLEHADDGERWLAFEQDDDFVFWQPRRDAFATLAGRPFALGEDIIGEASTYAFDCALNIFACPLDWLRADRDGIVVLDWNRAFDRLRDVPRIAVAEKLLPLYRRHMRPARMPKLLVIPARRHAA